MDVPTPLERPTTDPLRALCIAIFVAPGAIMTLVGAVGEQVGLAPDSNQKESVR